MGSICWGDWLTMVPGVVMGGAVIGGACGEVCVVTEEDGVSC